MRRTLSLVSLLLTASVSASCSTDDSDVPARPAGNQQVNRADNAISFVRQGANVEIRIGQKPFTTLVVEKIQKPSLYPIFTPAGQRISRGFPLDPRENEEHDHPHHTSLWFAHGDVNTHDFWTGAKNARIVPVGEVALDDAKATITASFEWRDADDRAVCSERRLMRFAGDTSTRAIDFDITLTAGDAPVTFGDTKEGTFALRVAPTLNLKGSVAKGAIVNSEGLRDAECWGKRAAWVEYSGPVDGSDLGVAIFDHPLNPRHPTWWHARDYGLFAANPFGVHDFEGKPAGTGNLRIEPLKSIRFQYRLLIHDGKWTATQLGEAFKSFSKAASEGP
jgi:hypothetical protein